MRMSTWKQGALTGRKSAFLPFVFIVAIGIILPSLAGADTVTNCDIKSLISAINTDHTAIFDEDCSITLTNQIVIRTNVTIDAADQTVTLAGGGNGTNGMRLFYVRAGG